MTLVPAYWVPIDGTLVDQDGPALTVVLPHLVEQLTNMATRDGHNVRQLRWGGYRFDNGQYRLVAQVLEVVT